MARKRRKSKRTQTQKPKRVSKEDYRSNWVKAISDYVSETRKDILNLADQELGLEEVKAILNFLPDSQVTQLTLHSNDLDSSMMDLAPLLARTKIRKLDVSLCSFNKFDVLRLAEVLKESEITDLVMPESFAGSDFFRLSLGQRTLDFKEASKLISHLQNSKLKTLECHLLGNLFPKTFTVSLLQKLLSTSLTFLEFDFNYPINAASLLKSLSHSCVTELKLWYNQEQCAAVQKFYKKLVETKLEKLIINGEALTDDTLNHLADGLVGSKVTELTLRQNWGVLSLSSFFDKLKETNISTLTLSLGDIELRNGTLLHAESFRCSILTSLDLSDCGLSDEQGEELMESLRLSIVTNLNVSRNHFGLLTVKKLAENISDIKLVGLNISGNDFTFEDSFILGECLKASKLTRINVSGKIIEFTTVKRRDMFSFLKLTEGSSISRIEINYFRCVWDFPPVSEVEMLANTKFTKLYLAGSDFGDDVSCLLCYLKCTSITHLDLFGNNITDDGAEDIAGFLKDVPIRRLNLEGNLITVRGAKALAFSLKDSSLMYLNLRSNEISETGLQYLAEGAKESFVIELDVTDNPGKRILLIDTVMWENKTKVHKLVSFFKQIAPQSGSHEFSFEANTSDADVNTFLEKLMEFYKTIIDKPSAVSALLEEDTMTHSKAEIYKFLLETFPTHLSSFIVCSRKEADLTEHLRILQNLEEEGFIAIVESLLLHRPVFMIGKEEGILHPYVYRLLLKYKQPICNLAIEPDGVMKIINYFTEHAEIEGSQDLIELLRNANIS